MIERLNPPISRLFNLCGLDSPQLAANVVIPAYAGIQWFIRGHRPSPV
jgi:hypothetical protein